MFSKEGIVRIHLIVQLLASFVLALATLVPGQVQAQTEPTQPAVQTSQSKFIGRVVAATGSVTIEHPSAVVVQAGLSDKLPQTQVGDPVYLGDVVQTGADGRVGINFTDGTSFNLSSNAKMAMTEFVYDPNGKSNSTLLKLTSGTFTFVAGNIAKTGDMKIDTPVATMGIRGTTPRIEISEDGTVKFATLVEEGKSKVRKTGTRTTQQPEQNPLHKFNPNICRGC
uniref:FecR domain-containing protein n=1 Tax=Bradyrhizobium septentrionale TaxID=1404411 RepID=A0A973W8D5_9BRAD